MSNNNLKNNNNNNYNNNTGNNILILIKSLYTDNGAKNIKILFTKLTSKRKKVKHFKTPFDFG